MTIWLLCAVLGAVAGGMAVRWYRQRQRARQAAESALLVRARVLTAEVEPLNASGEYKRHQVYARLLKEFPAERKRDVAKAIEAVL